MKKSLFTLAALSAFGASAYAQSSVTLFGIVDAAVRQVKATLNKFRLVCDLRRNWDQQTGARR